MDDLDALAASLDTPCVSAVSAQWTSCFVITPSVDGQVVDELTRRAQAAGFDADLVGLKRWAMETKPFPRTDEESDVLLALSSKSLAALRAEVDGDQEAAARPAEQPRDEERQRRAEARERARREQQQQRRAQADAEERRARVDAEERRAKVDEEKRRRIDEEERRRRDQEERRSDDRRRAAAEAEWVAFWEASPATLQGDLREGSDGAYYLELRGEGVDGLDLVVEGDALRVRGVLVPGEAAKAALLRRVDERCPRRFRRNYREDLLRRLAGGRYGKVDRVVDLPRDANLSRAELQDTGDGASVLVRIPRVVARRPRRAAPTWYDDGASALARESSFPPSPLVGGGYSPYW